MSHESTLRTWTLDDWQRLCEHESPFVRLWVAKTARKYLDRESRSPLLQRLLNDEEPQISYHAEMDLLNTSFPKLGEWYLHIALRLTSEWGQVRSALRRLAAMGDGERLSSWLDGIRVELADSGPERDSYLQHLFLLPEYLVLMPLDEAEPVAEEAYELLRDVLDEEEDFTERRAEYIAHALAGLLLSHHRPREILDFLGQLDVPLEMSGSLAEIMGDSDWANSLFENRDDLEDEDDVFEDDCELPEDLYDDFDIEEMEDDDDPDGEGGKLAGLNLDFLQEHLSEDFLSSWEDYPRERPRLCLQHAKRLVKDVLPAHSGAEEHIGLSSKDFARLERAYALLEILADPDLPVASLPNDREEFSMLLTLLLSAGRACIGRNVEDFSREEMLSLISRDRPDMLQDGKFAVRLKSEAKDVDPSFREKLLERARAAMSEFGPAWTKRVLGLAPAYGLEELIPEIMQLFREDVSPFDEKSMPFLEDTLVCFDGARVWEEHVRQCGVPGEGPEWPTERIWPSMFYIQKVPCSEALHWLRDNLFASIQRDEMETLEAVRGSGDPLFIPVLQPLLADDEDLRGEVFQTLCRLHGDDRALRTEEENLLWERSESRHRKMFETARSFVAGAPWSLPSRREAIQLRCDDCGGVFHYVPERIVIYPPREEDGETAVDVGGDFVCKSCGATVGRLRVTAYGWEQITSFAFPYFSQLNIQADMEILGGKESTDKQILVCPKGQMCLGETVATIGEGLEKYEHLLASDPENLGLLAGKANLLSRLVRMREAETYYRRALEIDTGCIDALAGMYDLCSKRGREEEAWVWLQQAYSWLSRGTILRADPNGLKRDLLQEYAREASKRGMAPEQPIKSRKHRVKRNDPCPCGSGKKYKKCCLDR